jgi:hypothetical protein
MDSLVKRTRRPDRDSATASATGVAPATKRVNPTRNPLLERPDPVQNVGGRESEHEVVVHALNH